MAGVVDELVVKVGIEVDDKAISDLKKELQDNKKNTIKIRPDFKNESSSISSDPSKDIQYSVNKDKVQETLNKIYAENKKAAEKLEDLDEKSDKTKGAGGNGGGTDILAGPGGLLAIIAGILTGGFLIAKEIQQRYIEKLDREIDFANLAYSTGETADQMAKLNYQAKNVGLSLDQVVHNAQSFGNILFGGVDDQKAMLYGALGLNPVDMLKNVKTPEDLAKRQNELFKNAKRGFEAGGIPGFIASQRAGELAGIPQNQALGYNNLFSGSNVQSANEIAKLRGSVGSSSSIMKNYQDIHGALQSSTASIDRLLSTGDVAKKISMGVSEMTVQTANFINTNINPSNSKTAQQNFRAVEGFGGVAAGQAIFDQFTHRPPTSSSQTKVGGN